MLVVVSLSPLPMWLDVKASSDGIQLATEHLKPKDLLNKPFYSKFTIRILD
jgi:hypothetical protein